MAESQDRGEVSRRVMDSTLPLYGTWVGTILAFYFSRESFDAASQSAERIQIITRDQPLRPLANGKLSQIAVKSLANGLIFSETDLTKPLKELVQDMESKGRYRILIVDSNKKYVDLVYRLDAQSYITQPVARSSHAAPPSPEASVPASGCGEIEMPATVEVPASLEPQSGNAPDAAPPIEGGQPDNDPTAQITLNNYLEWRNAQGDKARPKVAFLPAGATLADADTKIQTTLGCRDIIVTRDGTPTSPVVVYITDADIEQYR